MPVREVIPQNILRALPDRAREEIVQAASRRQRIEEIRLHCGRRATLTVSGMNIPTSAILDRRETESVLTKLCEGSVYAFRDTIAQGYITLSGGIRVGVCGRAAMNGGSVSGIYDIDTLVIRIPHPAPSLGNEICNLIADMSFTRGVLIYAPPGVGKTTLLRCLAVKLASGAQARRVSVVDTRGELAYSLDAPSLCLDLLSGYPRELGISVASRTLGSEVIICDEIGTFAEAEAIRSAHNCGVPLIASAHAANVRELLGRTGIGLLHRSGCFGAYVGISRRGEFGFNYDICKREDADVAFLNGG